MKRIIIIFALILLASTASAQFAVSINAGGAYQKGSTSTAYAYRDTNVLNNFDTTYVSNAAVPLSFTGGIKVGYQIRRLQFGITGSFSWGKVDGTFTSKEYERINQAWDTNYFTDNFAGSYTQKTISWMVAPYLRYELIQLGDVAFFLELNGYFGKTMNPSRRDSADWYWRELHNTIDTTYTVDYNSTSFGAKIVPGMTWQLSEHCHVELYLDILAFTFDRSITNSITVSDEYTQFEGQERILSRSTKTTTESTTTDMGFGITGTPLLNNSNWVRVGFCYTF